MSNIILFHLRMKIFEQVIKKILIYKYFYSFRIEDNGTEFIKILSCFLSLNNPWKDLEKVLQAVFIDNVSSFQIQK